VNRQAGAVGLNNSGIIKGRCTDHSLSEDKLRRHTYIKRIASILLKRISSGRIFAIHWRLGMARHHT
jgi:hypothetical protein